MVVRVVGHNPERTKALDEVRAGIETRLRADKAQQAALQWAQNLQSSMFAGDDTQAMLDEKSLSWQNIESLSRSSSDIAPELVDATFQLSPSDGNNSSVVSLNNGNVGVVRLNAVNPLPTLTAEQITAAQQRFTGQDAQRTYQNFVEALRSNADIKIIN
jgi:peptidyl-prolyl cis-trans isomerase D